jgi:hypothetical protein
MIQATTTTFGAITTDQEWGTLLITGIQWMRLIPHVRHTTNVTMDVALTISVTGTRESNA